MNARVNIQGKTEAKVIKGLTSRVAIDKSYGQHFLGIRHLLNKTPIFYTYLYQFEGTNLGAC